MSKSPLPTRAKIVIIGGGVGGTSVAFHLAELGEKDVILLDRNELTSGSTFHSAGLVGQLRADPTLTKMNMHSPKLARMRQHQTGNNARAHGRNSQTNWLGANI
jgi:sarcosine dehydrogenase